MKLVAIPKKKKKKKKDAWQHYHQFLGNCHWSVNLHNRTFIRQAMRWIVFVCVRKSCKHGHCVQYCLVGGELGLTFYFLPYVCMETWLKEINQNIIPFCKVPLNKANPSSWSCFQKKTNDGTANFLLVQTEWLKWSSLLWRTNNNNVGNKLNPQLMSVTTCGHSARN